MSETNEGIGNVKNNAWGKADTAACLAIAALAGLFYGCSCAGYVFPGAGARLMAVWHGLDSAAFNQYPLFAWFAKIFGAGNAVAPVCGIVASVLMYYVFRFYTGLCFDDGTGERNPRAVTAGRVGGVIAALGFMMAPAVVSASTHVEPRIFDVMLALAAFALLSGYMSLPKVARRTCLMAAAILSGIGLANSPMFLILLPLYIIAVWGLAARHESKPYISAAVFICAFAAAFFIYTPLAVDGFGEFISSHSAIAGSYFKSAWIQVVLVSVIPFVLSLLAAKKSFVRECGFAQLIFHVAISLTSVMALATPLSASASQAPYGILPVAVCACAAWTLGYLATYWYFKFDQPFARVTAIVAGGVLAFAVSVTWVIDFAAFDSKSGDFADKVADSIVREMGQRTWLVCDGTLDNHIRFAAERAGKDVNIISLARDADKKYIDTIKSAIAAGKLGNVNTNELNASLTLGILPFVQDWFATDPEIASKVAIYGAPDLWYSANLDPVPEFFLFGGDPAAASDFSAWKEFDEVLHAPEGWSSFRLWEVENPVDLMRLDIRRHLGLTANNGGVRMIDEGAVDGKPTAESLDRAFDRFELIINSIDAGNISALLNETALLNLNCRKALAKKVEVTRKFNAVVDDKNRRYRLEALGNYYGYIYNPDYFVRLGMGWARSGLPGEALRRFRRAIDFLPEDGRSMLLNMMAALYASGYESQKSRQTYAAVLDKEANNIDALLGLARLELREGNLEAAKKLFEQALKEAGDDPRLYGEMAVFMMMNGELDKAKALLRKTTDAHRDDLRAWSLMAAVTIQQIDAATDENVKAALTKELEDVILPTMESQPRGAGDYYIESTRAFVLLRKAGGVASEENRRAARDAFAAAAKSRPDVETASNMVLGLDISLNDESDAEHHAREMLKRNRKSPLANYVMGSLALRRGDLTEAETFLRRSCDSERPEPMALNDFAEVLRRNKDFESAELYARKATAAAPKLYVVWETLASILLDAGKNLDEAEECARKACEMSKDKSGREADVRMLVTLARVQLARKDKEHANMTLLKIKRRVDELSEYERNEFMELMKNAR